MIAGRTLAWFILRLALIEALLIVPWFGSRLDPGSAYRHVLVGAGNIAYGSMGSQRTVRFQVRQNPESSLDAEVSLRNLHTGDSAAMSISTRQYGWLPTA